MFNFNQKSLKGAIGAKAKKIKGGNFDGPYQLPNILPKEGPFELPNPLRGPFELPDPLRGPFELPNPLR